MTVTRSVWGRVLAGAVLWSSLAVAADGGGGDPALAKAQIQDTCQKVIALLKDADLIRPEKRDRLVDELHAVLDERFDWPTIGRWVLATNRSRFDAAQTDEFAGLFADYAVLYYLTQVKQNVTGDNAALVDQVRIEYRDGTARADGSVSVEVQFTSPKGSRVMTSYAMAYEPATGVWRVRNFSVEGVSIVRNWRTELAPIKSREKILDVLRDKVAELRGALAVPTGTP